MVLEHIKSFCSEEDNTIFFLGGFHQGLPFVFTANTKDAEINFLLSENHTSGSVSYTHLDVYKRQDQVFAGQDGVCIIGLWGHLFYLRFLVLYGLVFGFQ